MPTAASCHDNQIAFPQWVAAGPQIVGSSRTAFSQDPNDFRRTGNETRPARHPNTKGRSMNHRSEPASGSPWTLGKLLSANAVGLATVKAVEQAFAQRWPVIISAPRTVDTFPLLEACAQLVPATQQVFTTNTDLHLPRHDVNIVEELFLVADDNAALIADELNTFDQMQKTTLGLVYSDTIFDVRTSITTGPHLRQYDPELFVFLLHAKAKHPSGRFTVDAVGRVNSHGVVVAEF